MPKKLSTSNTNNPEQEKPEFFSQKVANPVSAPKKIIKTATRDIKKQIASIYENSDPTMSPPPQRSSKAKIITFIILILAFLSAVSWVGFFMFGRGSTFDEKKIILSSTTEKQPLLGEEFSYQIKIKNNGRVNLNSPVLTLRYPQGFEFISAEPIASGPDNKEWNLGVLNSGQEIKINLQGIIWDNVGSENNLQMTLDYKPGDLNVEFQKVTIFKTQLTSPKITLEAETPTEGTSGTEIPLKIRLTNTSSQNFSNLQLSLVLPEGFKNNNTNWKNNFLSIATLPSSSSTLISTTILPTASITPGKQSIKIDLQTKKNNKIFLLQSISKEISISKSNLSLNVAANGESTKQIVSFGDTITFTVAYENNGSTELKNVTLRLILDTPSADNKSLFDWTQIKDKFDGEITAEQISPQIRRAIITWNKTQISQLANIKPKDKNSFEITLPIKQKGSLNLPKLTESKTTVFTEAILNEEKTNLQSNNLELILNSDLNLTSSATFKESQNLPLQVGKNEFDTKSIYRVTWELSNSLHEVTDLILTATIPENVVWEKNATATAGDIAYDTNTKQITWKLNRLPTSFPKVIINFDLGLKSSEQSSGQEMSLIEKTRVEAKDKITEENILFWKDPIITMP